MKKNRIVILILNFLVITSAYISITQSVAREIPLHEDVMNMNLLPVGSNSMDWTLKELLTDQTMTFSSFSGKVVLIDFFATWCGPCQASMPELREIRSQYSTSNVVIISLDTDPTSDSEATIEAFAEEYGMTWYIFRDTEGISNYYQVSGIPTFYVFDQNLKVYYSEVGVVDADTLISVVNNLLTDPPNVNSPPPTSNSNTGSSLPEFWQKNWYWIVILPIFGVIGLAVVIQRQRVIQHNKKVRQQKYVEKKRKQRKRLKYSR